MTARIGPNPTHAQLVDAAMVAIGSRDFYNVSLVNFVTPWTNVEQTVFADLNDYTATVIGMVRDGVPFDQVLTADLVYVAAPGHVTTPYAQTSNQHYLEIQTARASTSRIRRCSWPCRSRRCRARRSVGRRRGGRDHHARRGRGVLQRGHEPPHVALHRDELPVPRHGGAQGHEPPHGPDPPGREPQPGRRQRDLPHAVRRLSLGHGRASRAPTPTSSGTPRRSA